MCVFVNEIENHLTDSFESVLFIESVHTQAAWTVRLWIIILFFTQQVLTNWTEKRLLGRCPIMIYKSMSEQRISAKSRLKVSSIDE